MRSRWLREAHRTPARDRPSCDVQTLRSPLAPAAMPATQALSWSPPAFKGTKAGPAYPEDWTSPWPNGL